MLADDLGPAVFNRKPSRDDGRPVGMMRLLLRPAGLFGLALLALFAVTVVKLWREGVFESYRVKAAASVPVADKSWMLGDKVRLPPREKEVEAAVRPMGPPPAPAEQSVDDAPDGDDQPE